jgi:ligand-binding sensor domain-containing protein/AraC-like DNA-binding protein
MALDPGQSIDQYVPDQWKNKEGLASNIIYSIAQTPDGYLWIATAKGVIRFDGVKFSPVEYNKSQNSGKRGKTIYYVLFVDREETLWIGGTGELIKYQYQTGQFTSFTKKNGLKGYFVSYLYDDMKGNLWIGFLGGYLNRFTNGKFTRFDVSVSNDTNDSKIISIIEDSSKNLLAATQKNGIFQFRNGKFLKCDIKDAGPKVNKIYKDRNGELWIGTNKGLVHIIDKKTRIYSFRDGLSNENITNIEEDSHGNLWVGTLNGLNRVKKNGPGRIVIEKRLENHLISYLFEDREDNLWIGTAESGVIRLKNAKFITHPSTKKDQGRIIYAVFEDRQGDTWVGANEGKLHRYRKDEYIETLQIPGKLNTNIICIDEDSSGNLWMGSCEDGVFKWERKFNRFINFTTRDGELLFVTKKGITMVHPGKIKINRIPPPVIIEDFFFNGRDRYPYNGLHPETIVFKGMNHIGFHFTAPTFLSPAKIKFKYKLEGHDKDWACHAPGAHRYVFYEDLEPGTYIFKVTACSSDGIWNNTGASMAFTIKPCFQNSTSFKLLLLLGGLTLVAAAVFLFKKFPLARNGKVKYNNSHMNHVYVKECIKKLDYFMEIEKVYRDENISLQSLSKKISITPHQLSRIINEKLDKNFPDFINTYRVEEAKKILADPRQTDRKILTIAFDVGFNTKVAFNTAFKKYTKMTPSEFRKNERK